MLLLGERRRFDADESHHPSQGRVSPRRQILLSDHRSTPKPPRLDVLIVNGHIILTFRGIIFTAIVTILNQANKQ